MNKTLILLVLFILLGGGAWYMMQNKETGKSTANRADADFAIENLDEIYKIFIADRSGNNTLLERKSGYWLYNKAYKARPNVMSNLLATLKRIEVAYTTPRAAEENMIKNLATSGIKVEIYGKNDKKIKTYYVGGSTMDGLGTFMIMEGASEPYIVHIPGWDGTLKGRYSMREDDWKDRTLFDEEVQDIQSVSVQYYKQKNKSFKIEKNNGKFEVLPFYSTTPKTTKPELPGSIEKYLIGFEGVTAEDFENNNPRKDSVLRTLPFSTVTMVNMKGDTSAASFYPIIERDAYGNPIHLSHPEYSASDAVIRYFIGYNDGSFRVGQQRVLGKLFWDYTYFFKN